MSISEHNKGLAYTIEFKCNRGKKRLNNHHLPPHIPQQTKHNSGDRQYGASKWYSINFQWFFGMHLIGGGGENQQSSWEF